MKVTIDISSETATMARSIIAQEQARVLSSIKSLLNGFYVSSSPWLLSNTDISLVDQTITELSPHMETLLKLSRTLTHVVQIISINEEGGSNEGC